MSVKLFQRDHLYSSLLFGATVTNLAFSGNTMWCCWFVVVVLQQKTSQYKQLKLCCQRESSLNHDAHKFCSFTGELVLILASRLPSLGCNADY